MENREFYVPKDLTDKDRFSHKSARLTSRRQGKSSLYKNKADKIWKP